MEALSRPFEPEPHRRPQRRHRRPEDSFLAHGPAKKPELRLVQREQTPTPPPLEEVASDHFGPDFFAEVEEGVRQRELEGAPLQRGPEIKITGRYEDLHAEMAQTSSDETEQHALLENIGNAPDLATAQQTFENARHAGLLPHSTLQEALVHYLHNIEDTVAASQAFDRARAAGLLTHKDLLNDLDVMAKINRGVTDAIYRNRDEKQRQVETQKQKRLKDAWDALATYKEEERRREDAAETDITIPEGTGAEPPRTKGEVALAVEAFGTPAREIDQMITEELDRPLTAGQELYNKRLDGALAERRQDLSRYVKDNPALKHAEEKPVILSPRVGAKLLKLEQTEKAFREQASWNFRDLIEDFNITNFYINNDGSIPAGILGKNRVAFELFKRKNPPFARRYEEMKDRYLRRAPLTEAEEKTVHELKADGGLPKPEGFLKKALRKLGWLGAGAATAAGGYAAHLQQEQFEREKTAAGQVQHLNPDQLADLQTAPPSQQTPISEVLFPAKTIRKAVESAVDTVRSLPPYEEFTFTDAELVEGKRLGLQVGRDVTPYLKSVFERLQPGQEQRVPFGDTGRMFINVKKVKDSSGKYHGEFSLFGVEPRVPADLLSQWVAKTFGLRQPPEVKIIKEFQSTGLTRSWINGQISYTSEGPKIYGNVDGLLFNERRAPSPSEVAQEEKLVKAEAPAPLPGLRADFVPQTVDASGRRVSRSEAPEGPLMPPEFVVKEDRSEAYDDMVDRAAIEWERAKQEWADRRRRSRSEDPSPKTVAYETPIKVRPEDLDRKKGRGKEEESPITKFIARQED